jgi:hypothetical protein
MPCGHRFAVFSKRAAGIDGLLGEGAVAVIAPQQVGAQVVRHKNVLAMVVIIIKKRNGKATSLAFYDSRPGAHINKILAGVTKKAIRFGLIQQGEQ